MDHVKKNFYLLEKYGSQNLKLWKEGKSIIEISKTRRFPPTLVTSSLLRQMGYSKKYTINHLEELPDQRLASEITAALDSDPFFSPWAHSMQAYRGALGEEIIAEWLEQKGLQYKTEVQLRKSNFSKTPDFLLDEPIRIEGKNICWIESKAVFGGHEEHEHYLKKQFMEYESLYGSGLVVYWYGYIDSLSLDGHLIKDYGLEEEIDTKLSRKIIDLLNLVPGIS